MVETFEETVRTLSAMAERHLHASMRALREEAVACGYSMADARMAIVAAMTTAVGSLLPQAAFRAKTCEEWTSAEARAAIVESFNDLCATMRTACVTAVDALREGRAAQ